MNSITDFLDLEDSEILISDSSNSKVNATIVAFKLTDKINRVGGGD